MQIRITRHTSDKKFCQRAAVAAATAIPAKIYVHRYTSGLSFLPPITHPVGRPAPFNMIHMHYANVTGRRRCTTIAVEIVQCPGHEKAKLTLNWTDRHHQPVPTRRLQLLHEPTTSSSRMCFNELCIISFHCVKSVNTRDRVQPTSRPLLSSYNNEMWQLH